MDKKKYVLCRPQGGLTDQLVQIGRCIEYADHFDRILIIDNQFHNFLGMTDDLRKYFSSTSKEIILNLSKDIDILELKSIFPQIPQGNISSYTYHFSRVTGATFFDESESLPITFDFSKDYSEQLLIHHRPGCGSEYALLTLSKFKLNLDIVKEIQRRYHLIGGNYDAIHIRNTDVRTDFISCFEEIKKLNPIKLFIATDSLAVIQEAKNIFGDRIYSFSNISNEKEEPLHIDVDPHLIYSRYRDAICDLLMLGLSDNLYISKVRPGMNKIYSGFSELGMLLNKNQGVVKNLINTLS